MSNFYKHKITGELIEYPPYKCKICGMDNIEFTGQVCRFCGWEDDTTQNHSKDIEGYANQMSYNQYKKFWEEYKNEILANLKNNRFYAIEKSQEYYKNNFKELNDKIRESEMEEV